MTRTVWRVGRFLLGGALFLTPRLAVAQGGPQVDLGGTWAFNVVTDAGSGTPTVQLKQQGDSLSGRYSSQVFGEVDVVGSVKGREFSFRFTASLEGQSFTVTYTGTLEGADALKGTVDLGGFGSGSFTARRQSPTQGSGAFRD